MSKRLFIFIVALLLPLTALAQFDLSVHGYLNQAYAVSYGKPIFGISKEGTMDYRHLALQFRNDISEDNTFILQFSHRRLGDSPAMEIESDVELDWAFLEHRFNENFSVKTGKIQLPFGFYNEIRDVGVLLPFFQVPYMPYGEANYMSETIDGISLKYSRPVFDEYTFNLDVYLGQWRWTEWRLIDFAGTEQLLIDEAQVRKAFGYRAMLKSDFSGLSVGLSGFSGKISEGVSFTSNGVVGPNRFWAQLVSIDYTAGPFSIRTEPGYAVLKPIDIPAWVAYLQLGYQLSEKLSVFTKGEYFHLRNASAGGDKKYNRDYYKDAAVSLKYAFSLFLSLKLEYHVNQSYLIEEAIDVRREPSQTQYGIISLSTSF